MSSHKQTGAVAWGHRPTTKELALNPPLVFPVEEVFEDDATDVTDVELSDEELTALALADDPDRPLGPDAVALPLYAQRSTGGLPLFYMPPVMARATGGWRTPVVMAIIVAFLMIDAFGLCMTYGQLVAA